MWTVTTCCGFSLRTGTFCVGVFSLIRAALLLVMGAKWVQHSKELNEEIWVDDFWQKEVLEASVLGWASIMEGLTLVVVSGFLLISVCMESPGFLYPWLVWGGVGFVLNALSILCVLLPDYITAKTSGLVVTIHLWIFGIVVYFYIIVLSYKAQLEACSCNFPTLETNEYRLNQELQDPTHLVSTGHIPGLPPYYMPNDMPSNIKMEPQMVHIPAPDPPPRYTRQPAF